MTRDEAIAKMKTVPQFEWGEDLFYANWIDSFVALGMLKLEEPKRPKNATQRAMQALDDCPNMPTAYVLKTLDEAGLKIVEK